MKKRAAGLFFTLAIPLVSGCLPAEDAKTDGAELFEIAADTVPCVGVAPMQCLVVNGTLFYDPIEGYTHVEGQAAKIYVEKIMREGPLPADVGMYLYRRVAE